MKKDTLIITLIAVALTSCIHSQSHGLASRCKINNWDPKTYPHSASAKEDLDWLTTINEHLLERRVFIQVTKGTSGTDVRYYEQKNGDIYTLTESTPDNASALLTDIERAIAENKRKNCVGEKVKELLERKQKEGAIRKVITSEVHVSDSPAETFAPAIKAATGKIISVIIYLLC